MSTFKKIGGGGGEISTFKEIGEGGTKLLFFICIPPFLY